MQNFSVTFLTFLLILTPYDSSFFFNISLLFSHRYSKYNKKELIKLTFIQIYLVSYIFRLKQELECQVLQSLLFCMHAFLTAKVASVDPAFLSSIQQT